MLGQAQGDVVEVRGRAGAERTLRRLLQVDLLPEPAERLLRLCGQSTPTGSARSARPGRSEQEGDALCVALATFAADSARSRTGAVLAKARVATSREKARSEDARVCCMVRKVVLEGPGEGRGVRRELVVGRDVSLSPPPSLAALVQPGPCLLADRHLERPLPHPIPPSQTQPHDAVRVSGAARRVLSYQADRALIRCARRLARPSAALSLAYWLVSTPLIDHDPSRTLSDIKPQIEDVVADSGRGLAALEIPALKVRTPCPSGSQRARLLQMG